MSPVAWRCSRLVRLLAVLWAVGRSGASQPQRSAGVGTAQGLDQLLRLFVQDVTANIQPLTTKLASRFDGLDARLISLDSRLNGIEARLNSLRFKQDSFDARLDGLDSRVNSLDNTFDARLDELNSVVGGVGPRLDELAANMDSANKLIDSRLEELTSRANSAEGSLGSRLDELASEVDSAENRLEVRLDELVSRVDGLAAERGGHLNNVSSHLDELSSRLDELANLTDPRLHPPRDCSELPSGARSGIHLLQPGLGRSQPPVKAYCDLDTDGGRWTVIQRRADVQPRQDFNLEWSAYREGFGDLEAEFWWGLENLWRLTGSPQHRHFELRVNLADFDDQRRYASYGKFTVSSEADGYRLSVGGYTGDAGDSLSHHSGQRLSTKDRDHDSQDQHCAQKYKAGWWFKSCYESNLNGQYLHGQQTGWGGVNWEGWRHQYSLKEAEMKVRPVNTH